MAINSILTITKCKFKFQVLANPERDTLEEQKIRRVPGPRPEVFTTLKTQIRAENIKLSA